MTNNSTKQKYIINLISLLAITTQTCFAQTVFVSSRQVPEAEFREVLSKTFDGVSLLSVYESAHPSADNRKLILRTFEQAQAEYLDRAATAKEKFLTVSNMALVDDWKDAQRTMIFYSRLRLAQLSDTEDERSSMMNQAIGFAPDMKPDPKLFPPPFIEKFKKAYDLQKSKARVFELDESYDGYQVLKVDGRVFQVREGVKVELFPEQHRVSLLSLSLAYVSTRLTSSQWPAWKPAREAIAQGSCQSPSVHPLTEAADRNVVLVWPKHCLARFQSNDGALQLTQKFVDPNSGRLANGLSSEPSLGENGDTSGRNPMNSSLQPALANVESFEANSQQAQRPFWKNPWFWVGTFVVAGGVYALTRPTNDSSNTAPSHSSGF